MPFDKIACQCGKGFKQGTGKKAKCVPCLDGTYAPLDAAGVRTECRACPRDGVSCNDGVLTIRDDYWYDAKGVRLPDAEGKIGLGPTTTLYQCTMRDACLVDRSAVPMTMYCDANHTGVMCARCYSRRADCGRSAHGGAAEAQDCPAPAYFERGEVSFILCVRLHYWLHY